LESECSGSHLQHSSNTYSMVVNAIQLISMLIIRNYMGILATGNIFLPHLAIIGDEILNSPRLQTRLRLAGIHYSCRVLDI
jgi:hypothetical protein